MNQPAQTPVRWLIAGTGTGVGKTYVTGHLVRGSSNVQRTLGLKPIESGFVLAGSDAEHIAAPGQLPITPRYAFRDPVSPHLAARSAGEQIHVQAAVQWVEQNEALTSPMATFIETAGGLFTPLGEAEEPRDEAQQARDEVREATDDRHDRVREARDEVHGPITNVDLIVALQPCRWVLVAADRLGVLNDVLTARAAARWRTLPDAIVLTEPHGSNDLGNLLELRRFCAEPVLHVQPEETLYLRLTEALSQRP